MKRRNASQVQFIGAGKVARDGNSTETRAHTGEKLFSKSATH